MPSADPYLVLTIHADLEAHESLPSPVDDDARIRYAYRRALLKTHPDRGGDREAFETVQKAYEKIRAERSGETVTVALRESPESRLRGWIVRRASDASVRMFLAARRKLPDACVPDWVRDEDEMGSLCDNECTLSLKIVSHDPLAIACEVRQRRLSLSMASYRRVRSGYAPARECWRARSGRAPACASSKRVLVAYQRASSKRVLVAHRHAQVQTAFWSRTGMRKFKPRSGRAPARASSNRVPARASERDSDAQVLTRTGARIAGAQTTARVRGRGLQHALTTLPDATDDFE